MSFRNPRDTSKFGIVFDPADGKTDQLYKNDCDINHIISRYKQGVPLPDVRSSVGQFLDISNVKTDYDDRLLFIKDVDDAFMAQPSDVRKQFKNDPALWLSAVHDGILEQETALNTPPAEPQKPLGEASTKAEG